MSERTPLVEREQKTTTFFSNVLLQRKRKLMQFQCCVCAFLIALAIGLIVVGVSFVENKTDNTNATDNETAFINAGNEALEERDIIERSGPILLRYTPSFKHQRATATSERANSLSRTGYAIHRATLSHASRHGFHYNDTHPMETSCDPKLSDLIEKAEWTKDLKCHRRVNCNPEKKYRSYDGSCNNLKHPGSWGVAFTPFRRELPAVYKDGIGQPRGPLPPATTISNVIHRASYSEDPKFTVMLAVWGQFMDHDITATALSRTFDNKPISCCPVVDKHPECFPVIEENGNCIEFVRSAPAINSNCCLGPRNQLNQATAYLDGSVVYGAEDKLALSLRSFKSGTLKMLITDDGRELLPVSVDPDDGCNRPAMENRGRYCFTSGDARANENLHLTSMHLIWARQHNRIAAALSLAHPDWNDERLYQESRRIVVAQIQHITYSEFLPIVLGEETMEEYRLKIELPYRYDPDLDASIANEFAAAAFRFAHSLIPGLMKMVANDTSSAEYIQLHKMLFDPFALYEPGELDRGLRGAMQTNTEPSDPYFTDDLKQKLFVSPTNDTAGNHTHKRGLDLVALNIQRGRDHGLAPYTLWRERCGLVRPTNFSELTPFVDGDSLARVETLYESVDDIDLYTGALAEMPTKGSLLGPTAICIIADQFRRIRHGDRFWYENDAAPAAFTPQQILEIQKTTLSIIICENSDNITVVPISAMRRIPNSDVNCSDLDKPNFQHW